MAPDFLELGLQRIGIPTPGEMEDALLEAEQLPPKPPTQERQEDFQDWPSKADLERERQILDFLGIQ